MFHWKEFLISKYCLFPQYFFNITIIATIFLFFHKAINHLFYCPIRTQTTPQQRHLSSYIFINQ
jgi:hypothetical protein